MKLTKVLAGSTALTLSAAGLAFGIGITAAEAATDTFALYQQINNTAISGPYGVGSQSITMTVTPTSANAGDPIEIKVTSNNFDIPTGPASDNAPNSAELDAIVTLDGVDYVLRGPQNTVTVPVNDGSTPNTPLLFKKDWVISSTAGQSVGVSNNGGAGAGVSTPATTGLGTSVRGAEATIVPLLAPGPGNYTIGLKALAINSISGSGTASLVYTTGPPAQNGFDSIINTTSTGACAFPGVACAGTVGPGGNAGSFATNNTDGTTATKGNLVFGTPVTLAVAGAATAPGKPTSVTGSVGNGEVPVIWTAAPSNGSPITSSKVTASPGGATCTAPGAGVGCTVTGLTNGQAYTFTVVSTNAIGDGPASDPSAPVTPSAPTKPAAPGKPTATAGNALVDVDWPVPASDGGSPITKYTATSSPGGKTCEATPPSLTCTVEGLTNGTAYTFKVTATNAVGTSDASVASNSVTPSDGSTPTDTGSSIDTGPRSASSTQKAYCDVQNAGLGALANYQFPITLTVSPGAAQPGDAVEVSVAVNSSPINSGPTELAVGAYRMEATVKIDGKSYQLIGPTNAKAVQPETGLIFAKSQWPTVAKGAVKLPTAEGDYPVTVQDIWYNNVKNDDGTANTGLDNLFDNRCNASSSPRTSPKAFAAPTVDATADNDAAAAPKIDDPQESGDQNGVLAATGANALALGLLALAALQIGAIVVVRAQRARPVTVRGGTHRF